MAQNAFSRTCNCRLYSHGGWYWKAGGHARASSAQNGISEKTFVCNSATRKVMTDIFDCDPERVECMYIGVDHN